MGLFGRRKPLHEQLAEAGGMLMSAQAGGSLAHPPDLTSAETTGVVAVHGVARPRRWDVVVSIEAPSVRGDIVDFVALEDGMLVVEAEEGDADLDPIADAVETQIERPYRAHGVRQSETVWAVSANRIEIARFESDGDAIELAMHAGERTATVDGEPTRRPFPELEQLGERESPDYAIRAERLDGELWEVQVSPL